MNDLSGFIQQRTRFFECHTVDRGYNYPYLVTWYLKNPHVYFYLLVELNNPAILFKPLKTTKKIRPSPFLVSGTWMTQRPILINNILSSITKLKKKIFLIQNLFLVVEKNNKTEIIQYFVQYSYNAKF